MKLKKINITLTSLISITLILTGIFIFNKSYIRLIETFRDFGTSIKYFFLTLFEVENPTNTTVVDYSKAIVWNTVLPEDFATFKMRSGQYFSLLFSSENFLYYLNRIGKALGDISRVIVILLPCFLSFG